MLKLGKRVENNDLQGLSLAKDYFVAFPASVYVKPCCYLIACF